MGVTKEAPSIKGKETTSSKHLTLVESTDKSCKWDINEPRGRVVYRKIALMIARDSYLFCIADDDECRSLLHALEPQYNIPTRKYFSETIMPKLFEDKTYVVDTEI